MEIQKMSSIFRFRYYFGPIRTYNLVMKEMFVILSPMVNTSLTWYFFKNQVCIPSLLGVRKGDHSHPTISVDEHFLFFSALTGC
jgi:hypothetical protein